MGRVGELSLISKRMLQKKRNRLSVTVRLDQDLYRIIKEHDLNLSDVVNLALEKWLIERGFLDVG